jgi:chromosome partitioning protein
MERCKVIAVANQKGGVGKTTTALNVAIGMVRNGYDVLIVDFDPQGDLTSSLGWKTNDALENSVSSMLDDYINDEPINYDSLILNHPEDVDVIPANIELADFEMRLVSVINREQTLSNCIEPLRSKYDYIFIDCPPSLGMLTVNALAAADEVLIPVQTQYLPAKGMTKLLQTVNKVQRKINSNLKINGIVMTLADSNTNITRSTIETIRESFSRNIKVFDTIIPKGTKASEATTKGISIYKYAKDSKVALAYESLTKEIMNKDKEKQRNDFSR